MKARLTQSQVLQLKMIPKTYSLLSTTFEVRWLVLDGSVKTCLWVGGRPVGGSLVGGRWFFNVPSIKLLT